MNRLKKIGRSVISSVLIAGLLMTSTAVAPMTVEPAQAIAPLTIIKKGFGGLSSIASSVGPSLIGKILNMTGNTELADFFGLNTNMHLMEVVDDVKEMQEDLDTIQNQVDDLEKQLTSIGADLKSWDTLTSFFNAHGTLITNCDTNLDIIKDLAAQQEDNPATDEAYEKDVSKLMDELYQNGDFRTDVLAMGDAIMGRGTGSMGGPTEAYYINAMQLKGITRDELMQRYVEFTTTLYKDYVSAVMLANGAMAYKAQQEGSGTLYET